MSFPVQSSARGAGRRLTTALIALAFLIVTMITVQPVLADAVPGGAGYKDHVYGTALAEPTEDKPQSKVWYTDGSWWGGLWNPTAGEHQIYRLVDQEWVSTGVTLDRRSRSHADYLWDGTALYVASPSGNSHAEPILVFRYTYDAETDTYALDPAFTMDHDGDPTLEPGIIVGQGPTETVTIAKDSTGQLWVTYTNAHPDTVNFPESRVVMVNRSTTDESTWGTPFQLSTAPTITDDDISAIVAFGSFVGVMWTNQLDGTGSSFGFSVHADAADDEVWGTGETAAADASEPAFVDDHINLKTTADGRVIAAVKTNGGPDHIQLLVRATNGSWSQHVVVGADPDTGLGIPATRPQVVIDTADALAHVLYTIPVLDTDPGDQAIYVKSAPLDTFAFPDGNGTAVIAESGIDINNVASTKQSVDGSTDLLAIAGSETNDTYYHAWIDIDPTPDTQAPTAPTGLGATATGPTSVELTWTASTDNVGVVGYGVYRDDVLIATATSTSYTDTTAAAETSYTYAVDAVDAAGNRSAKSASANVTTPADTSGHPFTDIDGNPFESEIIWIWEQGITTGCTDTLFCPKSGVTREQMASFIARALDLPPPSAHYFVDVAPGSTHAANINKLYEAGITLGCSTSGPKFCPKNYVLREQMASFLARARDLPPPAQADPYFIDVVAGSTHAADINRIFEAGITNGCSADGPKYCPKALVLREQMAAFIFRAFNED